MNIYEDEQLDQKFEKITDLMADIILDIILVSLKKINNENLIFQDINEVRLETAKEDSLFKRESEAF